MVGYGRGYMNCDLLLLGRFQDTIYGNRPLLITDSMITFLDIKPMLSSSHCLGELAYLTFNYLFTGKEVKRVINQNRVKGRIRTLIAMN